MKQLTSRVPFLRGLKGKTIIDVDGVVDIENKTIIDKSAKLAEVDDLLAAESEVQTLAEQGLAEGTKVIAKKTTKVAAK